MIDQRVKKLTPDLSYTIAKMGFVGHDQIMRGLLPQYQG